jgi:hypothetical protein
MDGFVTIPYFAFSFYRFIPTRRHRARNGLITKTSNLSGQAFSDDVRISLAGSVCRRSIRIDPAGRVMQQPPTFRINQPMKKEMP